MKPSRRRRFIYELGLLAATVFIDWTLRTFPERAARCAAAIPLATDRRAAMPITGRPTMRRPDRRKLFLRRGFPERAAKRQFPPASAPRAQRHIWPGCWGRFWIR